MKGKMKLVLVKLLSNGIVAFDIDSKSSYVMTGNNEKGVKEHL